MTPRKLSSDDNVEANTLCNTTATDLVLQGSHPSALISSNTRFEHATSSSITNETYSLVVSSTASAAAKKKQCDINYNYNQNLNNINAQRFDWWNEVRLFLELAVPIMLFGFGFMISPFLTASIVGRKFGATYLSAFTLGNLTGNLCNFTTIYGLFSVSDTLSPQAYGMKNYKQVGLIAIRGVLACATLLIPINIILVLHLKDILLVLGQDEEASELAQEWYRIFVLAIPFCVIFYSGQKFLLAQHCMKPLIIVILISGGVILPIGLEIFTESVGFLGSAMAYVMYQASQATLLILYLKWKKPHNIETWPGLGECCKEVIKERQKIVEFFHLGAGGILAQSEWVFWETLGIIIGNMGVIPLTAHAIPNNLVMFSYQVPFAAGVAVAIRIGTTISKNVSHSKKIAISAVLVFGVLYGVLVSLWLYFHSDFVISIFTTNEEVIALAHTIWWKVCIYNVNSSIFGIFIGISIGLGMQWTLGAVNFFFVWVVGMSLTCYSVLWLNQGLDAAWTWINVPYTGINLCLSIKFITCDWEAVKEKVREQNKKNSNLILEETYPLSHDNEGIWDERKILLDGASIDTYCIKHV